MLIFANAQRAPLHQAALHALEDLWDAETELWISRQVLREYLAVFTRHQEFSRRQSASRLLERVRYFEATFLVAEDSSQVTGNLLRLFVAVPFGGKQVHDANIVATLQTYNIRRLLTHNVADFKRFSAYVTILPLESFPT